MVPDGLPFSATARILGPVRTMPSTLSSLHLRKAEELGSDVWTAATSALTRPTSLLLAGFGSCLKALHGRQRRAARACDERSCDLSRASRGLLFTRATTVLPTHADVHFPSALFRVLPLRRLRPLPKQRRREPREMNSVAAMQMRLKHGIVGDGRQCQRFPTIQCVSTLQQYRSQGVPTPMR